MSVDELFQIDPRIGEADCLIAVKIKEMRTRHGVSRDTLANKLGVSAKDIELYETAEILNYKKKNPISAGQLGRLAKVLNVDIQDFYESFYRIGLSDPK